ncbi:Sulfite oxidase [Citrus sinensis]|uniref:Sulfite oxidase n=1 Tax=Citrus sinensis TaxID=2711 RepID=A0ACB8N1L5_CITSI|nr:Sulfite oxidase [Citrus sinensis]
MEIELSCNSYAFESLTVEPFNAEPPRSALISSYVTPVDFFYKRNHGPIPIVDDIESYYVSICGLIENSKDLFMRDIRMLRKYNITATLQCAGNRRTAMSNVRTATVAQEEKMIMLSPGLTSYEMQHAVWSGAKLADVLELVGIPNLTSVTRSGGKHVEFVSIDKCKEENGGPYKASIPLSQATNPEADVLLAYEMNGEAQYSVVALFLVVWATSCLNPVELTSWLTLNSNAYSKFFLSIIMPKPLNRDHGYPLRVVVPGVIGARSVKWLDTINILAEECQGFFMQKDYKMFPPSVNWDNINWKSRRPLMDFPVQHNTETCWLTVRNLLTRGRECDEAWKADPQLLYNLQAKVSGYAVSGGGRGIERVDISVDGGKNWVEASRYQKTGIPYIADHMSSDKWAWVFFEVIIDIPHSTQIVAKAVDTAANVQPESVETIWNLRGVLNTSWHRVQLALRDVLSTKIMCLSLIMMFTGLLKLL